MQIGHNYMYAPTQKILLQMLHYVIHVIQAVTKIILKYTAEGE